MSEIRITPKSLLNIVLISDIFGFFLNQMHFVQMVFMYALVPVSSVRKKSTPGGCHIKKEEKKNWSSNRVIAVRI